MERVVVVVVLVLVAVVTPRDNPTTLQEYFIERYGEDTHQMSLNVWREVLYDLARGMILIEDLFPVKKISLPLMDEILQYLLTVQLTIIKEFASDLGNVTLQSIYKDLNDHCSEYLETPIDLTDEPSNVTCVILQLRKTLTLKLKMNIQVGLKKVAGQCNRKRLPFCSKIHTNCTVAYEGRVGKALSSYVEDGNEVASKLDSTKDLTPLEIIKKFLHNNLMRIFGSYIHAKIFMTITAVHISSVPSIEPFTLKNILPCISNRDVERRIFKFYTMSKTEEQLTWVIVKRDAGSLSLPCSHYRDTYPKNSQMYLTHIQECNSAKVLQLNTNLINCLYTDPAITPLSWSTVPSAYFHSQCLCLAYNGTKCGVKAPQGVDPRLYCLSVLLRDFQRQISYRPAVTYLDYAFQTRVPVCQLVNILQNAFTYECKESELGTKLNFIISMQCYFKNLVNKNLNCSETPLVNTYNDTELCRLKIFMNYVVCEGVTEVEIRVPSYGAGDSSFVLIMTYLDVTVRVFTLVTYVACPELRNLPGKILIGYQVTAFLRLLVVRATLEDLAFAVRVDVSMDLAATLWLFSYLHFLTVSIKSLRPPDSLSPDKTRMVLLRYALLGWALPAALSASFFCMDEALDSRVQFGQLLFVLCNYTALFGNLYMAFKNFQFYYHVKTNVRILQKGGKARSVFAALFSFAVKTSVLSGAGIILRLIFTQIQGLELLLDYYHALGTLDGLLLFLLYGCNREARAFWVRCCLVNFSLASSSRE